MNTPEQPTAADINAMQLANSIAASFIEGDADMKAVCADEIATLIREHVARETAALRESTCATLKAASAELDAIREDLIKVDHDARNAAMESAAKDAELAELRLRFETVTKELGIERTYLEKQAKVITKLLELVDDAANSFRIQGKKSPLEIANLIDAARQQEGGK